MDPATTATVIAAVAELAKLGMSAYISYMQTAGLSDTQIDAVYQTAKAGLLARDPAKIPDAK
jgi:hypothetical protein